VIGARRPRRAVPSGATYGPAFIHASFINATTTLRGYESTRCLGAHRAIRSSVRIRSVRHPCVDPDLHGCVRRRVHARLHDAGIGVRTAVGGVGFVSDAPARNGTEKKSAAQGLGVTPKTTRHHPHTPRVP